MAKSNEVLAFLRPNGGYVQTGETFEGIKFIECDPFTKTEYEAGFAQYDAWKAQQDASRATQKAALLTKLGITAEEAQLLLGGN
jgi:hypothetical protein